MLLRLVPAFVRLVALEQVSPQTMGQGPPWRHLRTHRPDHIYRAVGLQRLGNKLP